MTLISRPHAILWLALSPSAVLAGPARSKTRPTQLGAKRRRGPSCSSTGGISTAGSSSTARRPPTGRCSDGILTVGKGNIMTRKRFGDFQLHLEFNVPYMPKTRQGRGNSGVFLTGSHELQVLDSYELKLRNNDCGAIYKQIIPSVNACKPPLQWQTYDVTFHKAVVEQGKVMKKATSHRRSERRQPRSTTPRSRSRPAESTLPTARTARSCSRTTATRSSIAISGSSRSIKPSVNRNSPGEGRRTAPKPAHSPRTQISRQRQLP